MNRARRVAEGQFRGEGHPQPVYVIIDVVNPEGGVAVIAETERQAGGPPRSRLRMKIRSLTNLLGVKGRSLRRPRPKGVRRINITIPRSGPKSAGRRRSPPGRLYVDRSNPSEADCSGPHMTVFIAECAKCVDMGDPSGADCPDPHNSCAATEGRAIHLSKNGPEGGVAVFHQKKHILENGWS